MGCVSSKEARVSRRERSHESPQGQAANQPNTYGSPLSTVSRSPQVAGNYEFAAPPPTALALAAVQYTPGDLRSASTTATPRAEILWETEEPPRPRALFSSNPSSPQQVKQSTAKPSAFPASPHVIPKSTVGSLREEVAKAATTTHEEAPAYPETKQPPFPEDVYAFLELYNLSMLGVLLLCSARPEASVLRGILTQSVQLVGMVKASQIGQPWVLQQAGLCLDVLCLLQRLQEPQLVLFSGKIQQLQVAVQDICSCCKMWMQPGWLADFARGDLQPDLLTVTHTRVIEIMSGMGLNLTTVSLDHGALTYGETFATLADHLLQLGDGNMLSGCITLLRDATAQSEFARDLGIPLQSLLAGLDHPHFATQSGSGGAENTASSVQVAVHAVAAEEIFVEGMIPSTSQADAARMLDSSILDTSTANWLNGSLTIGAGGVMLDTSLMHQGTRGDGVSHGMLDTSLLNGMDTSMNMSTMLDTSLTAGRADASYNGRGLRDSMVGPSYRLSRVTTSSDVSPAQSLRAGRAPRQSNLRNSQNSATWLKEVKLAGVPELPDAYEKRDELLQKVVPPSIPSF